jgi:hypothetical protein
MTKFPTQTIVDLVVTLWKHGGENEIMNLWFSTRYPATNEVPGSFTLDDVASLTVFLSSLDEFMGKLAPVQTGPVSPLEPRMTKLRESTAEASKDGTWNQAPYLCGVANGMRLALGIMTDTEPTYLTAPEKWLANDSTEGNLPLPPLPMIAPINTPPPTSGSSRLA